MKEKSLKKFAVFPILLLLIVSMFIFLLPVNAISAETTGTTLTKTDTNQDTYVNAGGYDVLATNNKLLFYSSNTGNLEKTYDLPVQLTTQISRIKAFNTSHIIVATISGNTGGGKSFSSFLLNVNTLSATYTLNNVSPSTINEPTGMILVQKGTNYYVVYSSNAASQYKTFVRMIYPTGGSESVSLATNNDNILFSPDVYVDGSGNIVYCLSISGTNRAKVLKIDLVTPSINLIGTTTVDNTYGNFIYVFGTVLSSYGSGSSAYDIGIIYNNPSINKDIYPQIIRFNDTYVAQFRSTLSASSSVNLLRCPSVSYTGIWNRVSLLDGDYQFYYFGTAYGVMLCPFTVSGLSNITPSVTITNTPSVFGDNGVQWVHYYTASNSIGGLLLPSGNMIMYDYQNSKSICDKWVSLNPSYSYVFSVTPQPLQLIASGTVLRAVCMLGQQYTYNGEVFADGVRIGNGTYTVSSTGLSTNYNIATQGTYGTTSSTGSIINGLLTFTMSPRTSAYVTIYEGIKVSININGATQDYVHTFVWTSDVNEDGLQPSTAPTIPPVNPTNNAGMGGTNSINLLSGGTFIGVIIVVLFTMLFGAFAGRDGILAGLMFSIMIASLLGLFPIYGILLSVVFGAILLLSHTSIGRGGGSDGE